MVDVDVVVAGAGGAGLAAALRAAQGGRSVLLAEAKLTFKTSANTVMSTAMVPAGGSRWQAVAGVEDSPRRFLDDVVRKTGGTANQVVAEALTSTAPALVEWLADACGVPLELVTDFDYPGHSAKRCHTVADRLGGTLHRCLLGAAEDLENITVLVPRRVTSFDPPSPRGAATVTTELPDGTTEILTTRALVLATCGFGANTTMVAENLPEIAEALYFGSDGSTGEALTLGRALGADVDCLDAYQGHASVAVPHGILVTWATVMHGAVLVNRQGNRFGDESKGYSEYARLVQGQPQSEAWVVFDQRVDLACRSFGDYQRLIEADAIRWSPDVEALAGTLGSDPANLARSLESADRALRGEHDEFGRRHWEAPLCPPYGSVKVNAALFHTQGGLVVDGRARVLRQGLPIPGLYAAGGAAVGMSGHGAAGYLAGNGLLAALGLGFLAGSDVASPPSTKEH